ncbi:putative zinc-binding metallopeptidase [Corticibacterium sp. UT-5YL-CI-8]|nr:putative zinc-binding metallopeptidase [Tianweitania sp. UT-5YL-CI-8]
MKLFECPNCSKRLYFENAQCLNCGSFVSYDPDAGGFVLSGVDGNFQCLNATECSCNWTAPEASFCRACALNKIIPDLSVDGNRQRWTRVEAAKRRAIYSFLAFGLPVEPKTGPDDQTGIAFDFLASTPGAGPGGEHILTGHDNGLITLNVAEADSAEREKMRVEMGENYRTLLGHFRHELGHYYWDRLIRDDPARLEEFRAMFGDETLDYEQALQTHYAEGPKPGWQESHISAYAASHPWEDWAETWAHYIHITDTLEMVAALNFPLGKLETAENDRKQVTQQAQPDESAPPAAPEGDFAPILARWLVLSEASNAINRCMGLPDLYPFVISQTIGQKLGFVHRLLTNNVSR